MKAMIVLAVLLIAGCSGEDPVLFTKDNSADYFPLSASDTWYYTYTDVDTTFSVVRFVAGEDVDLGSVVCTGILEDDQLVECWTIDDEGVHIHLLAFLYMPEPPLLIPFEMRSDSPLLYDSFASDITDPSSGFRVKGSLSFQGYVTKTVPAGTFKDCLKLFYDDEDEPYYEYYAPGVGLLDNGNYVLDSARIGGISYGM
jgi:hypothetical protein